MAQRFSSGWNAHGKMMNPVERKIAEIGDRVVGAIEALGPPASGGVVDPDVPNASGESVTGSAPNGVARPGHVTKLPNRMGQWSK